MIDFSVFSTPCFVVDRVLLEKNLVLLGSIRKRTGAKILLALKGFAMHAAAGLVKEYLNGTCASSVNEARLGREKFGGEVHVYAPAFSDTDFNELLGLCDHIVLNSMSQYDYFSGIIKSGKYDVKFGLRINPEHSETDVEIYDPCARFSRLGITRRSMPDALPAGISGLHFHTLCQKNSDALARTLDAAEERFGGIFESCEWINFGGGHHITRPGYDLDLLCSLIGRFSRKYSAQIYLEPGEAVALNTGFLVATVLDVIENGSGIVIIDASAAAHIPDVLEMPFRPHAIGSAGPGIYPYSYIVGGISCLAGDVFGEYSFPSPLRRGDRIVFTDMGHYSMVKTNTFNGINLPDIYYFDSGSGEILHRKSFGYGDFSGRLS